VVVLEFWATWCQNCGEVHRLLNEALASSDDKDKADRLVVLSMAAEPANQISDYLQRHSLNYPVLFDRYARVRDRYHAPSLPTLVVIDRKGVVRFARAGAGENVQAALAEAQRLRRLDDDG
jgi:peroxiredoxin